MAQLAIKGHATRGKEVIQLLEVLGGKSNSNMNGYNDDLYYFIAKDGLIYGSDIEYEELNCKYTIFTLEEFEEKFPYKVGDEVIAYAEGCLTKFTIQDIRWNYELNKVEYKICSSWLDASLIMQHFKEELTMEKKSKLINIQPKLVGNECVHFPIPTNMKLEVKDGMCYLYRDCGEHKEYIDNATTEQLEEDCKDIGKFTVTDEYIKHYKREGVNLQKMERKLDEALKEETTESLNKWLDEEPEPEPEPKAPILSNRYDYAEGKCGYVIPDGYEFDSIKQGFKTEIIIRPIKPQYPKDYEECCRIIDYHLTGTTIIGYEKPLLENLQQLLICRDAYWNLAGEEMGLDKSWKQDYDDRCFIIANNNGNIHTYEYHGTNNIILAFPTAEMRDAFYENFKDLIEQCKELL